MKKADVTPVEGAPTYDPANSVAVLNPAGNLEPEASYTAIVRGGTSGVKDTSGNPLAADRAWSFTIAP